jgi:signal transduction histidine kinase
MMAEIINKKQLSERMVWLSKILLFAAVYYVTACLSLLFAFQHTNASPIWPPSGIAFAILLRRGIHLWPAIFIGALCANITAFSHNLAGPISSIIPASFFIGIGNTLEAMAGVYLYQRWCRHCNPFLRVSFLFKFIAIIPIVCVISSFIGSMTLCFLGLADWAIYKTIWFTWWLGDVGGVLTLSPFFLVKYHQEEKFLKPAWHPLEAAALISIVAIVSVLVFGRHIYFLQHPYILMPLVVWVAFRSSQIGVGVTMLIILGVAIWHTVNGMGPFVGPTLNDSLITCQIFTTFITVTGLVLLAVLNEKKQVEEEIKRYAQELKRSNVDLERFAAIASHDLKEPLRIVSNYTGLLARRYKGKFDADADQAIDFILEGVNKMRDLIQDLLTYSQVGKQQMKFAKVDTNAICADVIKNLDILIKENGAKVICSNLPSLIGDRTQLTQLFQNLVSNAIKFRSDKPPVIEIQAQLYEEDDYIFSVKDNGIGIHPDYFKKIFEIFERLHAQSEYSGTGIGLAICKKVVEGHYGQIWVESELGKGAVFYFRLPREQRASSFA